MPTNTKNAHKIFGRHTNIGKMMHKIYNAAEERNSYEPNVKLTLRQSDPTQDHQEKLKRIRDES